MTNGDASNKVGKEFDRTLPEVLASLLLSDKSFRLHTASITPQAREFLDKYRPQNGILESACQYLDLLKNLAPDLRNVVLDLSYNGWFIPIYLWFLDEDLYRISDLPAAERYQLILGWYREKFEGIAESICQSFPCHAPIIRQAIEAYRNNQHFLVAPIFFSQADDICREHLGKGGLNELFQQGGSINKYAKIQTSKTVNPIDTFLNLIWISLEEKSGIALNEKERHKKGYSGLNRHTVMHGECTDYGTQENSLKAFSLLFLIVTLAEPHKKSLYKKYPKYKDSGVEWIGDVPEGWDVKRIRQVANFTNSGIDKKSYEGQKLVGLCNYTDVYYNEFITADMPFMQATASDDEIARFSLIKGDLIITKDSEDPSDIGIPALVVEDVPNVVCGYHLTLIRSPHFAVSRLLHRALKSAPTHAYFFIESPGITRYGLGQDVIGNLRICMPPSSEIVKIVDGVDRETIRIDTLIAKKTRFIELLKEKRSAYITAAVTGKFDVRTGKPYPKYKDSGVEWIGNVPEHWRVCQVKHLGKLKGGAGFPPGLQGVSGNEIAFYKVSDLAKSEDGINLGDTENTLTEVQTRELGANIFDAGTLAWAKIGAALSLNRRRILSRRSCLDNNMTGFIVDKLVASVMYSFYLMTIVDFSIHAKPGAVPSFSEGDQGEIDVPCPPLNEQELIAQAIEIGATKIGALIQKTQHSIDLLKERRSAFITAAVTGKIDLRDSHE